MWSPWDSLAERAQSPSLTVTPSGAGLPDPRKSMNSAGARVEITPGGNLDGSALRELWQYRELLLILARRDIQVRYRQTAFGVAWALLPPIVTAAVFSVVFGRLAHVPSDGLPYLSFSLTGLVPWQFFATSLTQSSNSLVNSQSLITKVYFPRMLVPLSAILGCLPDLGISLAVLVVVMVNQGLSPTSALVVLPFLFLFLFALTIGAGLLTSALNVEYRDVRHAIPVMVQLWMFVTPIVYPSSIIPEPWRWLLGLNPMASVVDGFRWALLAGIPVSRTRWLLSVAVVAALLLVATFWFRRTERYFADTV